jgi:quinol monooxygenase YgiN
MFIRFVDLRVQPDKMEEFEAFYASRIAPALKETDGCLFAGLLSNPERPSDCVSMTFWDSPGAAHRYEDSGLFATLFDEADQYMWRSAEWRIRLSDDLTLQYEHAPSPPSVEAFPVEMDKGDETMGHASTNMYVRIVSGRVLSGKLDDLVTVYENEVAPTLLETDGCRYVYLARGFEDADQVLSITLWDSRTKAEEYEQHGKFETLLRKVSPMLASGIQWQMTLNSSRKSLESASDDGHVEGFQIVTSEAFR